MDGRFFLGVQSLTKRFFVNPKRKPVPCAPHQSMALVDNFGLIFKHFRI